MLVYFVDVGPIEEANLVCFCKEETRVWCELSHADPSCRIVLYFVNYVNVVHIFCRLWIPDG